MTTITCTKIIGCDFNCLENALDGTIVAPFSSTPLFYSLNTTYSNAYYRNKDFKTTVNLTDSNTTFLYCSFTNCTSDANGGAIHAQSPSGSTPSIVLDVSSCSFTNCSAEKGGCIFIDCSDIRFTCYYTSFTDFKATAGGILYLTSTNSRSFISFDVVRASNTIPSPTAAALHVRVSNLILNRVIFKFELYSPQMIDFTGRHLSFLSSQLISISNTSGSLIVVSQNTSLSLKKSTFVITGHPKNQTVNQSIFAPVDNLTFYDFQENGFFVTNPGGDGFVLNLTNSTSFHSANDGTSTDFSSSTYSTILAGTEPLHLSRGNKDIYVVVTGSDTPYCSTKMVSCQTMNYLFKFRDRLPYTLHCESNLTVETPIEINPLCTSIKSDFGIYFYPTLTQSDTSTSALFFIASSSHIRLEHLSFQMNPAEISFFQMSFAAAEFVDLRFKVREPHPHPITLFSMDNTHSKENKVSVTLIIHEDTFIQACFFNVSASVCLFSNSELKNVVLSDAATLFFDSIPTLSSCTFENVSVPSEQNPFLLNYFHNADNLIENCLFQQCSVSHGSLINVCARVKLVVKHCSFCDNEGSKSGCILVLLDGPTLFTVKIEDSFFRNNRHRQNNFINASQYGNDITSTNITNLSCVDTRFASRYPQIVMNNEPLETNENIPDLYLDPIGNDSIGCGTSPSNLCKTFLMAMNLQGNATNDFFLRPSGLFCEKGVECIKKTMTILGQKHTTLEISNEASSFIVRNESFLTVKKVIFHIDKLPHGHYFTCLDSTLIIDDTDYTICFDDFASDISRALTVSLFVATRSQLNITDMRFTGSDSLVISAPLVSLQNSSSDIQIDFWKVTVSEDVSLLDSNVIANNSVLIHNCSLRESEVSRNSSFCSSTVGPNGSLKVVNCSFHRLTSSDDETYHLITLNVTSIEVDVKVRNNDYSSLAHADENGTIVSISFPDSQNHSEWLRQSFPAPYPGIEWNSHMINAPNEEHIFSLIIDEKDEYHVSPVNGSDSIDCGDFDTPCKTIKFISTTIPLRNNKTRKLHLMDYAQNTAPINDSMCHEFTGIDTNATLSIGMERLEFEPVFKCDYRMTIHHLAIVAPHSITGDVECHPLIKTTKAHLIVDSVTFQQSSFAGAINVIFLEATKSNVDLVDCTFQHIKTQVILVKVSVESGNTVNMAGITFSVIDLSVTQNISLDTIQADHQSQTNQDISGLIRLYNVSFKDIEIHKYTKAHELSIDPNQPFTGKMLEVTVDKGWDMTVVNTTIDKCHAIGTLVHFVVWNTVNISSIQIRSGHVTSTDTHNTHLLWIECKSPQNLPPSVDEGLDYAILHLHDLNMTSSYCEQPSSDTSQVRICGGFVKFDVGEKWTVHFQNGILKRLYPNTNNSFGTVLVNFSSPLSDFSIKGLEFDECATARGQKIGFIFQESVPRNLNQKLQVKYQYEQRQYFEYQISGSDRIHSLQYVQALTPWHIALLSLAFLVALPVVLNFLFCFPSLPVLFCFRKRYSSKPQRLSRLPRFILPDGGLGQTDSDSIHKNLFINSGTSRLQLLNDPHAPTQNKHVYTRQKSDGHTQPNTRSHYSNIVKQTLEQMPVENTRDRESSSSSQLDTWMENSSSEILDSTSQSSSKHSPKSRRNQSKGTTKKKRGGSEGSGSESRMGSSS